MTGKFMIRKAESVQVGYTTRDSQGRSVRGKGREIKGYIVTDLDGYERWFDTNQEAVEWIRMYEANNHA